MNYNIEGIVKALTTARKDRRLSQRNLSKKVGIPQSHISKIEKGIVNIKISTLVELARALDLEIALVPRKAMPAVTSITRSTHLDKQVQSTTAKNSLIQITKAIKKMQPITDADKEIKQIQNLVRELSHYNYLPSDYVKQINQVSSMISLFKKRVNTINDIRKATRKLENVRNQIVHGISEKPIKATPAYSLDDDENG